MDVTAYLRPDAIVCYEASLLVGAPHVLTVLQAFRATDLVWHWLSVLRVGIEGRQDRHLTPLSAANERLFLEDLTERDTDGYGRAIVLIGSVAEGPFPDSATELRDALTSFACGKVACIEAVVTQLGDSPVEQVFVSANPSSRRDRHRLVPNQPSGTDRVDKSSNPPLAVDALLQSKLDRLEVEVLPS